MKKETREKLYKIGEVAEILGVHEDTLRNWEKEGLIKPERIGRRGDRRYTAEMIGEIRKKGLVSDLAKKAPAQKKDLGEYTKEELIKELQILKKQKKYGLVWEDHIEEVVERCKTEAPILERVKDKAIKDKDKNKPTNILIEGDNYHALQVLNYTHKGKIDVIYIDPPYNTGNKDFVYNDHYVDKEDNFRHSKWISFMESRLRLARKLLKQDGIVFISIDDNEMAQLKILSDGVFGEEKFIGSLIWKRAKGGGNAKGIVKGHDFILVYAKGKKKTLIKEKAIQKKIVLRRGKEFILNDDFLRKVFGKYDKNIERRCLYEEIVEFKGEEKKKEIDLGVKNGLYELLPYKNTKKHIVARLEPLELATSTFYSIIEGVLSEVGKNDLEKLGMGELFDYPKPVDLIKQLINSILKFKKNSVVLDFMAGSGTTGHAVLDLNKEDDGNRKFILCTNNELNGLEKELREKGLSEEEIEEHGICRKITHKRIEKVMKGYTTPKGKKVKGLGGSLEYFKTEFVDIENIDKVSDKKKLEFTYEAGQMIALKEDTFKEIAKNKFYQIFTDEKDKFVGIYFRENLDKLAEMEKKILDKKDVKLYLFSYGVNDYKKDYTEYKNVTVKDIPEPILKLYKRLNN